jgi:hypothetical protein
MGHPAEAQAMALDSASIVGAAERLQHPPD